MRSIGRHHRLLGSKKPGLVTITIGISQKQVECDFEFVQVPIRVYDGIKSPQKARELVESIGFPDSKTEVYVTDTYNKFDGFEHEYTGSFEHWRYDKFPGLIIAVSRDDVIAIATENTNGTD